MKTPLSEAMVHHGETELNELRDNLELIHSLFDDKYGHNLLSDDFPELSASLSKVIEDIGFALDDLQWNDDCRPIFSKEQQS